MTTTRWLETLSTDECRALLERRTLGRVGVSIDALPVVLPVLYRVCGDEICFLTEEGTKLRAAVHHTVVAFEVDHLDGEAGWSVLVVGRSHEEHDPERIAALRVAGLVAGAPGTRDHLVCIPIEHITGRYFSVSARDRHAQGYL